MMTKIIRLKKTTRNFTFQSPVEITKSNGETVEIIKNTGPRAPYYYSNAATGNTNYQDYYVSLLEEGDLVWDTISTMDLDNTATHMGMIVNLNKYGNYTDDNGNYRTFKFVETVEADASGVRFGFLDDERVLRKGTKILRVQASDSAKRSAVQFMLSQLGKPYSISIDDPQTGQPIPGANQPNWYCTKLVFCAYYNAGVNICAFFDFRDYFGRKGKLDGNIIGHMIYNSDFTYELDFTVRNRRFSFLEMKIQNYERGKYTVRITNNSDEGVFSWYTKTMYFFNDIVNGYMDEDLECVYLDPHSYFDATISENFLATSIFSYYIYQNEVYCSVAHKLNKDNKSMLGFNFVEGVNGLFVKKYANEDGENVVILSKPMNQVWYTTSRMYDNADLINCWNFKDEEETFTFPAGQSEFMLFIPKNGTYLGVMSNEYDYIGLYDEGVAVRVRDVFSVKVFNGKGVTEKSKVSRPVNYVGITIVSKAGSTWVVKISNFSDQRLDVYYFDGTVSLPNLMNWRKPSGVVETHVNIAANGSALVRIIDNRIGITPYYIAAKAYASPYTLITGSKASGVNEDMTLLMRHISN